MVFLVVEEGVQSEKTHATQGSKGQRFDGIKFRGRFIKASDCDVADLLAHTETESCIADFPLAKEVVKGVPVYDWQELPFESGAGTDKVAEDMVAEEWAAVLMDGPGAFVIKGAFASDLGAVDAASKGFDQILSQEKAAAGSRGDHFAEAGANSRIWNALEKLAVCHPEAFVRYYSNSAIALAARAWLGPHYQMTSQLNVVHPGGQAQSPHRDYHLGFQTNSASEKYPTHVHDLSPLMTLQGAIAHCDMPLDSGPTMLLPHSQKYKLGYLAWRQPAFVEYFDSHYVQIPLSKGDALFFNPALFHAGGKNSSADIHRSANLLQVSSAMGRAMETVDRRRMVSAIFPALIKAAAEIGWSEEKTANVVAASAEGYSFPTNLDRDVPIGGLAPETQAEKVLRGVAEKWTEPVLKQELDALASRRCSW
mmetsp:Transcript_42717/g.117928  ORF Transcript_42717/g.117928 Transcript_42717/m.117928 type:complete len:423 (+) Transcript_42717:82-1350(+)|eukprot:CAMPEP_0117466262 /NCGR_PEP_ID=MMETSP0784-20121206/5053_1 /TAXON_ID=39447 /ORGANISM="" /LENGTH=422 /DNA_ID=CAMNT_0005260201 /DNA_START=29 /DNA_END=1297 /DNA_ORIENTATION=-